MSAPTRHPDTALALLGELQHAHRIIGAMLGAMTSHQKAKVHLQLGAGASGEGLTRANERCAAIKAASASMEPPAVDGSAIRQHATDIGTHAARLEILLLTIIDKAEEIPRSDQTGRAAADAIECFATCALRNGVLMREAAGHVEALALEGDDI